tara:strand:+ start:119 stop:352 length:234 start_codon:yes stop_codon:yes gene_type:complete
MSELNKELKAEFERVVDLLIQIESARESISSLLKDIKEEHGIEIPVARRVANVMRKNSRTEEEEKWEEFNVILDTVL